MPGLLQRVGPAIGRLDRQPGDVFRPKALTGGDLLEQAHYARIMLGIDEANTEASPQFTGFTFPAQDRIILHGSKPRLYRGIQSGICQGSNARALNFRW